MQAEYQYPIIIKGKKPDILERNLNNFKLKCKEKALKEYIKTYSILDISKIYFEEMVTKSFGQDYTVYNIRIITSEF